MKYLPLFLTIMLGSANGKSNSSGPDSPVLYGEIIAVNDDRKTVTILQPGSDKREITITKKTKLSFVGMGKKSQELKVGYWGKAKVKKGEYSLSIWYRMETLFGTDSFPGRRNYSRKR